MENEWDAPDNSQPTDPVLTTTGEQTFTYAYASGVAGTGTTFNWNYATPEVIMPISYRFQEASWRYTFVFAISLIFAPIMIIWSKFIGREVGIKVKNTRSQTTFTIGIN